MITEAKY